VYRTPLPFTIGEEGAGTVAAVGQGVTEVKVGDRVAYGSVIGGYASTASYRSDGWCLYHCSRFDHATALMLQGLTAHYSPAAPIPPGG